MLPGVKVLFVRLSAIGDVIQGIPALVALKRSFPDWRISWLVEETSAPLLEKHPCLDRLFILKRRWRTNPGAGQSAREGLANHLQVLREIRRERFDIAIDLQGLFKSGLWTWLSGAPRRIGHNKTREFAHLFLNEYAGGRPVFDPAFPLIERYLEPVRRLGADPARAAFLLPEVSDGVRRSVENLLALADRSKPWIAFCPKSHWPSKDWPVERWRSLAGEIGKSAQVLLIGAGKDSADLERIADAAPGALNLAGKTTLLELVEIFRRCRCVAGPDTGPLHLANAVNSPRLVMIFGATSFRRSGPWGKNHFAISRELSCQPCFARSCRFGHTNCLGEIPEAEVRDALLKSIGI